MSETARTTDAVERDLYDQYLYINREISWLQFNDRVLAMAADPGMPLVERLKYLAIFSTNLDEFFMVRVAGLRDQVESGMVTRGSDGWTPSDTLEAIAKHVGPSIERLIRVFLDEVVPAMAEAGIRIADIGDLDDQELDFLRDYFQRQVFPVLTPLAVDPSHPFPYISNLSLSLAVTVRDPGTARDRFARVKVPGILPRFVPLGDGNTFVPLEQVIATHLDKLFPGMRVVEAHPFRITACGFPTETGVNSSSEPLIASVSGAPTSTLPISVSTMSPPRMRAATSRGPTATTTSFAPLRRVSQRATMRVPLPESSAVEPSGFQITISARGPSTASTSRTPSEPTPRW